MKSCTAFIALAVLASASAVCPDDDHKFWDSDPTTFDWASVDDKGYVTYTIDPSKDTNEGGDFEIDCLCWVKPGDSCRLLDGDHRHDGLTFTHGTEDKPITIYGESKTNSCIKGSNTQDRALQIAHNHYTVTNLCFDGKHGDEYVSTAVYVLGADKASTDDDGVRSSVTGFKMFKNEIKNWKEECVHLRYFVTYSEIYDNLIHKCGMHCFGDRDEDDYCSVGEAVYVGTALDQVKDGKTPEVKLRSGSSDKPDKDVCRYNWIHSNDFVTYGNECVDIKEGSEQNVVEHNTCQKQRDENSGCMGSRGSNNCFRHNSIDECRGAGVRVGGDKGHGEGNCICNNVISNAKYGAFNIMTSDQGPICGNELSDIDVVSQGVYKEEVDSTSATEKCDDDGCCDNCCIPRFPETCGGSSGTTRSTGGGDDDDDGGDGDDDDDDDEGGNATPLEEEKQEETYGQNHADEEEQAEIPEEDKIFTIETNSLAGGGLPDDDWDGGMCKNVVKVSKIKVEHKDDRDTSTSPDNLFDGEVSLESYFSVNRFMTSFVFELEEETEVDGIAIGFFMKNEDEERIQTFDVAVRSYDEEDYTTVIASKESSGEFMDMQHFEFTSSVKAQYVRVSSKGNDFNNWTAFTEIAICGVEAEENALFGGLRGAKNKMAELSGSQCSSCELLAPVKAHATTQEGDHIHVHEIFDGDFSTRWYTEATQASNDLDNGKVTITFLGDQHLCHVDIAMFDGHLAHQYVKFYKQAAGETTWTAIGEGDVKLEKTDGLQTLELQESGVYKFYIVGHGNDVGAFNKISEVQFYGC